MNLLMREPSVAVPPSSPLRSGLRCAASAVLFATLLAGCGQKGPLALSPATVAPVASAPTAAR